MDEQRFQEILDVNRVAIVHFSHHAVMGHRVTFPDDLHHAISSSESETRSCCAVCPNLRMDFPGSVGVMFKPKLSQVISVSSSDSGSSDFGGEEGSLGHAPTEQTILDSLCVPEGGYNEWRVCGAEPIGIFIANPDAILVKKELVMELNDEMALALGQARITEIGSIPISLQDVRAAFPSMSVFTMGGEGLELLPSAAGV